MRSRDAVRQARQKVADILKADPIDQAALDQALAELSQKSQAIMQLGNTMMVEVAKQLSARVAGAGRGQLGQGPLPPPARLKSRNALSAFPMGGAIELAGC